MGKITLSEMLGKSVQHFYYLNWDNTTHQHLILGGPTQVAHHFDLAMLKEGTSMIVFDELHKYSRWKQFLKGFYDTYYAHFRIV